MLCLLRGASRRYVATATAALHRPCALGLHNPALYAQKTTQIRYSHSTTLPPFSTTIEVESDSDDDYDEDVDGPSEDNLHGFANDFIPLFRSDSTHKREKKFRLSKKFVDTFKDVPPPFGFNGLGELVYMRTYSRDKADGTKEQWYETVERVVNGTYNMQKHWLEHRGLGWNGQEAHRSAREMFRRIFNMKFLPPGRGLWAMGSPITEERKLYAALNNCAFVSTEDVDRRFSPAEPFCFLMDAAMLGVGVGFDTKGAGKIMVKGPKHGGTVEIFNIADSREGWVESLRVLLEAYFLHRPLPAFDYSQIRPAGMAIKGFGGISSGPDSLKAMHANIMATLDPLLGSAMTVRGIVDLMNHIGVCVVSGNVRRTAEIAFGDANDPSYVCLKDYAQHPERAAYGWTSNNSVFATLGMDYAPICHQIVQNGEPGFAWLQNMQEYSRMDGVPDHRDARAAGGNPCLEQTLESYELCCLVETFPANHSTLDEYKETLRYAYLYAKTVTLGQTHWPITNRVMLRNRRIGCSMSGIAQFITQRGLHELKDWCTQGYAAIQAYDKTYSDFLAIPRSIKTTSIKPSGTVSLLAGATPGMHYPESRFYIRRVRLDRASELLPALVAAGYQVEPAAEAPNETLVVSIPVDVGENVRTLAQLSAWEQLSLASFLQRYWADNQVSCTIAFDPVLEGSQLEHALAYFQYQLKGVSLLPKVPHGAYAQMPYEEISEATYRTMVAALSPVSFRGIRSRGGPVEVPDRFCDTSSCETK
ncbi:ribonucleoside-triphosphate reductase, adenosylcobalamin-dependent [Aphanomyces invadans]|uniref:ribonucleoside-triphosphate reductase (thioredoxin) n=2 Tax=Aphanomyces invadans TaxID=157072 RepID=A0A024U326_9STRA|nr:ribonucleoside-triphosphate reductase, adenosylcobalamin-dependent [Aphanomyces invadans]ETW00821.1 ribonucleoside-triphosphate reductase, adenosylcobalamin-dependent [Aphanomyces invadans]|eukprot:XP_008870956.1 ribonucleoside-triphosphate reductase, adenosylcobalamin-dependent [Aphanomyces invadans]